MHINTLLFTPFVSHPKMQFTIKHTHLQKYLDVSSSPPPPQKKKKKKKKIEKREDNGREIEKEEMEGGK